MADFEAKPRTELEIIIELRQLEKRLNEVAREACEDAKLEVSMDSYCIENFNNVDKHTFNLSIKKSL